jgi:HD superfamily phosphodiesterase
MNIYNFLFNYVIITSKKYNIDESHSLKHSLDVFDFANEIVKSEVITCPLIKNQTDIILSAAILHDMCDKKYRDEQKAILELTDFLEEIPGSPLSFQNIDVIKKIILTMSYSTVKKNGYPNLGEYQHAYHIVREADLLAGYDFDRAMVYQMIKNHDDYTKSIKITKKLFDDRILRYRSDNLFITPYSIQKSLQLHNMAIKRCNKIV